MPLDDSTVLKKGQMNWLANHPPNRWMDNINLLSLPLAEQEFWIAQVELGMDFERLDRLNLLAIPDG